MSVTAIGLIAATLVYARGVDVLRRHARHASAFEGWRVAVFVAGQLALAIAILPWLEELAEIRFPAHMVQHEILLVVAPPLLALGRPGVAFLWALPQSWRAASFGLVRALAPVWRAATNVVLLFAVHALVTWSAHIPAAFNATLAHPLLHGAQHALMLLTSVLFWSALVEGRYGRIGYGAAAAFVFATSLHTGLLGAGITFASTVLYAPYAQAGGAGGFDALHDQQLAGLLMWIPAGVLLTVAGLAFMAAWIGASEHRAQTLARSRRLGAPQPTPR
jgi:putative membrane protein